MKKMKLAVVFAALVSAFTFSSCLNGGDSGPSQGQWIVNIDDNYMGTKLSPDGIPGVVWNPNAASLSAYGIKDGSKRALITYTIPEGQEITETSKSLNISLVAGGCAGITIAEISNQPDTFATKGYTSSVTRFSPFLNGVPAVYTNGRYLMINCLYQANKLASVGLAVNRVSAAKDTLYLDLKTKIESGSQQGYTFYSTNYDLESYHEFYNLIPSNKTKDSIYVTVRTSVSDYGQSKMDSLTTKAKFYNR